MKDHDFEFSIKKCDDFSFIIILKIKTPGIPRKVRNQK